MRVQEQPRQAVLLMDTEAAFSGRPFPTRLPTLQYGGPCWTFGQFVMSPVGALLLVHSSGRSRAAEAQ